MNRIKQKELLEKSIKVLDLIDKAEHYIKAQKEWFQKDTPQAYRGQIDHAERELEIKKQAKKRLEKSYSIIIKQLQ